MLTPERINRIAAEAQISYCLGKHGSYDMALARAIEAEARRDALEEAAAAIEKATYRKRWAKAAVNGQASNVPPCELAAAIRAIKEAPPTA